MRLPRSLRFESKTARSRRKEFFFLLEKSAENVTYVLPTSFGRAYLRKTEIFKPMRFVRTSAIALWEYACVCWDDRKYFNNIQYISGYKRGDSVPRTVYVIRYTLLLTRGSLNIVRENWFFARHLRYVFVLRA